MKLIDLEVRKLIDEIDSKSPAPGGGSVSALSSAIGVSLARMVGHLTVDKKKFLSLSSEIQFEFKDVFNSLIVMKNQLIELVDEDTDSFNLIMAAYQMPKETEEDIKERNKRIQEATLGAIMVPVKVASLSLSAMKSLDFILQYGNKQAISDLGVAALSLATGIEGACLNILINLPGLDDQMAQSQYKIQALDYIEKAHTKRDAFLKQIYQKMNV